MALDQHTVMSLIQQERIRQDKKWGTEFHGRPDMHWYTILAEEFGEVAKAILENEPENALEAEIVQVAAVCVSWLEYRTLRNKQRNST